MSTSKINRVTGTTKTSTVKVGAKKETPAVSFFDLLQDKDEDRQKRHLEEILRIVDEKGKKLGENRTVESLMEYKNMVKGFIEEAVEYGLKIEERRGFSRGGRSRVLRTVAAIDEKLLELTDLIIKQEEKNLGILKKVGEIKGLLVNLYL